MSRDVYVVVEHLEGKIADITFELLGRARDLARAAGGATVAVVVPGRLDAQPAYGPFVEMAARHAGPDAATLLSAYFACGDVAELQALAESAGLRVEATRTRLGHARFDSVDAFVAAEVESTSVQGVVRFVTVPYPRLVLTSVPLGDSVGLGERVVTSGLSQHFPRGLLIGTVSRLGRDPSGLTQDIELDPAARLSRVRHAFVLHAAPGEAAR